jgi:Fe-S-cluster containining protein
MDIDLVEKLLREVYALIDEVITNHFKEHNITLICSKGCSICCKNTELPVLDIEMRLIKKYIKTMINSPIIDGLLKNIKYFDKNKLCCPFLVNKICSVYEVRPIVCRVYYRKNKKCVKGEDANYRRLDIVSFDREKLLDAIKYLSPIYGYKDYVLFRKKLDEGFIYNNALSLYDYNMKEFVENNIHCT